MTSFIFALKLKRKFSKMNRMMENLCFHLSQLLNLMLSNRLFTIIWKSLIASIVHRNAQQLPSNLKLPSSLSLLQNVNLNLIIQKLIFISPINQQNVNFDINHRFGHHLLEAETEDDSIKSFEIVGNLCDQSHRSNASMPPFKEPHSNNSHDHEEMEDMNIRSTFEHSLVEPPSKLDIKPAPINEETSGERIFLEKVHA